MPRFLKNFFISFAGFFVSAVVSILLVVTWYFAFARPNVVFMYIVFCGLPLVLFLGMIFVWFKNKLMAIGMFVGSILVLGPVVYIGYKTSYNYMMRDVIQYPGRIMITSNPPGAKYYVVDTNTEIVPVSGAGEDIYYSVQGKIAAVHPDFPGVVRFSAIKEKTKRVDFNFK